MFYFFIFVIYLSGDIMKLKSLTLKKLICYLIFIFIVCLSLGFYALLLYKNKASNNEKTLYIYSYIIGGVLFFILGLLKGLIIKNNGLLEGLLSGLFVMFIILLTNFIINKSFTYFNLIKIVAYLVLATIGGIIGVNLCKKENN